MGRRLRLAGETRPSCPERGAQRYRASRDMRLPGIRQFGYSCNQYFFASAGQPDYRKSKTIIAIYDIGPVSG